MTSRRALAFCTLFAVYVFSYVSLSVAGRYEPAAWGTGGVKWYSWAPAGFVRSKDLVWRRYMIVMFYPLYKLDTKLWHTEEKMFKKTYPANVVGLNKQRLSVALATLRVPALNLLSYDLPPSYSPNGRIQIFRKRTGLPCS